MKRLSVLVVLSLVACEDEPNHPVPDPTTTSTSSESGDGDGDGDGDESETLDPDEAMEGHGWGSTTGD